MKGNLMYHISSGKILKFNKFYVQYFIKVKFNIRKRYDYLQLKIIIEMQIIYNILFSVRLKQKLITTGIY